MAQVQRDSGSAQGPNVTEVNSFTSLKTAIGGWHTAIVQAVLSK